MHAEAKDKGRTLSARQLALCDWVIFLTHVPSERLSVAELLVLARARWQMELVFKLWKLYGQVHEARSIKPYQILCEVYAKLFAMLLQLWVTINCGWQQRNRSWLKTAQTIRQHVSFASGLGSEEHMAKVLTTIQACLAKGARLNTRKTKPNFINFCSPTSRKR